MDNDILFFWLPRWADIKTWSDGAPPRMKSYFNRTVVSIGIAAILFFFANALSMAIVVQKELGEETLGTGFLRVCMVITFVAALVYAAFNALRSVQASAFAERNKARCEQIPKTWHDAFIYTICRLQNLAETDPGSKVPNGDLPPAEMIEEMIRGTKIGYDYVDTVIQKLFEENMILYDERQFILDARPFRHH